MDQDKTQAETARRAAIIAGADTRAESAGLLIVEDGDANTYAGLANDGGWLFTLLHNGEAMPERQRANVRRLAACWNACAGIPTESLEAQGVASAESWAKVSQESREAMALYLPVHQICEAAGLTKPNGRIDLQRVGAIIGAGPMVAIDPETLGELIEAASVATHLREQDEKDARGDADTEAADEYREQVEAWAAAIHTARNQIAN